MFRQPRSRLNSLLNSLVRPRNRFLLASAVALLGLLLPLPREYWDIRVLLAYVAGLSVELVLIFIMMYDSTAEMTMQRSRRQEPSNLGVLLIVLILAAASLSAIALMLNNSQNQPAIVVNVHMGLSLLAIFLSWLFVHTYFAFHYAQMYYDEVPESELLSANEAELAEYAAGLEFPNSGLAGYWDFLYYSFTIAMCYQTSDISVTSIAMRRITLIHAIVSFIFVSAIIGLLVNLISNLI